MNTLAGIALAAAVNVLSVPVVVETARAAGESEIFDHVPEGYTAFEMAESVCGSGYFYAVKEGKYPTQELGWLGKVVGFLYGGKRSAIEGVEFEEIAQYPVSSEEMNTLIKDQSFHTWAGPKLIDLIKRLDRARTELYTNASSLPKGDKLFSHKLLRAYTTAESDLLKYIKKRFGVVQVDNGENCD